MMTHSDPPSDMRSASNRRRAARVRPGPLRVRLHRTCEGFLVDISEQGALIQLPLAQTPQKQITLHLDLDSESLELLARVVRSIPHKVQLPSATVARTEYQVAVEFSELPEATVSALKRLLKSE